MCALAFALQLRSVTAVAADAYLWAQSMVVSGLHFAGIIKPNPAAKEQQGAGSSGTAGEAVAATAETARAAVTDPSVIKEAVEGVTDKMKGVAMVSSCHSCCSG